MSEIALETTAPLPPPLTPPSTTSPSAASAASDPVPSTPDLPPAMLQKASSPLTAMPGTPRSPLASMPVSPKWISPRRAGRMATDNAEAGPSTPHSPAAAAGPLGAGIPAPENSAEKEKPKYLQPDSFYPLHNGIRPSTSSFPRWQPVGGGEEREELSPEDDPLALRGIPIFRPTMEEFKDFEAYVERTAPWGSRSGIVKIIPPTEWSDTLPAMDRQTLSHVKIKNPIQQNMMGTAGIFRASNIEKNKNRPLSVKEWYDKCQLEAFAGPSPRVIERDSKEAMEMRREAMAEKKALMQKKREDKLRRKAERQAEAAERASEQPQPEGAESGEATMEEENVPPLDPSSSGSSHSSPDPTTKTPEAEEIEPWYRETDLSQAWLPKNTVPEDYTPEACKMLQDKFWKNMGLGEPSWYGADLMQGSLFAEKETPWNVAHLPNLLNRIQCVVPGVNEPYLYFGMWRAQFPWHVEDMDLFSINYIHFGAPKFWYAIPQGQADLFERRLKDWFPQDAQHCDQFLRHKSCAISPTQLERNGIRANMLVHNQGEFVITYPRGYHAGFNMGFNCAESVNFALDSWIELGRKAKYCQCVDHSVRIDVDKMLDAAADAVAQPAPKKRRRANVGEDDAPPKRQRKKKIAEPHFAADGNEIEDINAIEATERRSAQVRVKLEHGEEATPKKPRARKEKVAKIIAAPPVFPCLFCPGMQEDALVPVLDVDGFDKALSKGRVAPFRAHTICAQAIPEVGIEEGEVNGQEGLVVVGLENIEKARLALKCSVCHDKSLATTGVKVQCTKGKCPRAFHPSCARNSDEVDLKVFAVEEPVPNPSGAEPAFIMQNVLKIQLLCPQHNPAMKDVRERKKAEQLKAKVTALLPGSQIKVRQSAGLIYQMKLVAVNEDTRMVEVELDNGQTGLYAWDKVEFKNVEARPMANEYAREYVTSRKNRDEATAPAAPVAATTTPPVRQPVVHPPPAVPVQQAARQPTGKPPATQSFRPFTTQQPQSFRPSSIDINKLPFIPSVLAPHQSTLPPMGPPPLHGLYGRHDVHERERSGSISSSSGYRLHPAADGRSLPPLHSLLPRDHAQPGYPGGFDRSRETSGSSMGSMSHAYYHHHSPSPAPPPHTIPAQPYTSHPQYHTHHSGSPYPLTATPYGYHTSAQPRGTTFGNGIRPPAWSHPSNPTTSLHDYRSPVLSSAHSSSFATHRPSYVSHSHTSSSAAAPPPSSGAPPSSQSASSSQITQGVGQSFSSGSGSGGVGKIDLGLDRMTRLMSLLPRLSTPAIHLAGTNGKGSVCAFLSAMLASAGLKVASYNSPYLIEPRDAIFINGSPPSRDAYTAAKAHIEQLNMAHNIQATTFELSTAVAFHLIENAHVDVMIIECGMGGAADATNVIHPELVLASGLTAVGLDHTTFLGDTVEAITRNKAAIAVDGGVLVVGPQKYPGVLPVAQEIADAHGATLIPATQGTIIQPEGRVRFRPHSAPPPSTVRIPIDGSRYVDCMPALAGAHQVDNLSTALTTISTITGNARALAIQPKLSQVSTGNISDGARTAQWRGRLSWETWRSGSLDMPILVDGAHNADSAKTLRAYLDSQAIDRVRWVLALSDGAGKTPESVLGELLRPGDEVWAMEFGQPVEDMPWIRAVPASRLAEVASRLLGPSAERTVRTVQPSGSHGLRETLDGITQMEVERGDDGARVLTVLCGSLYFVADYYRLRGAIRDS